MIKIFIVSLKKDTVRRKKISTILDDNNISYEFFDAVLGKELTDKQIGEISLHQVEKRHGRKLTKGEIGCTLSHLKVYSSIVGNKYPWACILEDDAILDERFTNFIKFFSYDEMNVASDLYLLGGQNGLLSEKWIGKSLFTRKVIGRQVFKKTIMSYSHVFRACGYLISYDMANDLISESDSGFFLADEWDFFHSKKIINNIYLADFVDHPIDLKDSNLEKERQAFRTGRGSKYPRVRWVYLKFKFYFFYFLSLIKKFGI
ncbi:glycosyltransferase family 25 protein [Rosenbergiella australiborealis]|uniref:glycosyltransferase family 25 protein n=1 Tax=Rosenbergiella australiborealis TaxID=1544696 RepID=UPI001F4E1F0F|nr:glycosyltransferase family 25 protein [Rosenbergiella australiborealis]